MSNIHVFKICTNEFIKFEIIHNKNYKELRFCGATNQLPSIM